MDNWINVEVSVPKMETDGGYQNDSSAQVLVYNGGFVIGYYNIPVDRRRKPYWKDEQGDKIYGVTHWQPLPNPPQTNNKSDS